jgi:hypothetical protein
MGGLAGVTIGTFNRGVEWNFQHDELQSIDYELPTYSIRR